MTTVVILQSNYVPWRGYFDLLRRADHFVFYDDVQFTKNDWRNRNRIVGSQGPQWLTIPVETGGKFGQSIAETRISDPRWAKKHLATLQSNLGRAPFFRDMLPRLQDCFQLAAEETHLSAVNRIFIRAIMAELGLSTQLHEAQDVAREGGKTGRLVAICSALGASRYLSGPAARNYLDETEFEAAGIQVQWMSYPDYPAYQQTNGGYEPGVSILDAMAWLSPQKVFG